MKTLEKILNSVKKIGKSIVKHPFRTAFGIAMPFIATQNLRAADIEVWNYTTGGPTSTAMTIVTDNFYNEAYKLGEDFELAPTPAFALEIFSKPSGVEVAVDARPKNTPGVDMDLRAKGTITGLIDNSLWFKVTDDSNLDYRKVIACDTLNPDTVYDIDKTVGEWTTINLPDIVGRSDEVYARWHIATPALVPGDIASASGVGILDGKVDFYDIKALLDEWLEETSEGENYLHGDVNYDGINNFKDFAIGADNYTPIE